MTTINRLSVESGVSPNDQLPIWSGTDGVTRRLPVSALDARYSLPQAVSDNLWKFIGISALPPIKRRNGDGLQSGDIYTDTQAEPITWTWTGNAWVQFLGTPTAAATAQLNSLVQLGNDAAAATALSVSQLNAGTGELTIVSAPDILRLMEPANPYQRVTLQDGIQPDGTYLAMGGTFYYNPYNTSADDTAMTIRTTTGSNKAWQRVLLGMPHLNMYKETSEATYYEALMRWDATVYQQGSIPSKSIHLTLPLDVPVLAPVSFSANRQYHLWSSGGPDAGSVIYPVWTQDTTNPAYVDYTNRGVLEHINTGAGQVGFSLHNALVQSAAYTCHGIKRTLNCHYVEENCQVLNFNGSARLEDGPQDCDVDTMIQACGRTSGSRTAIADVSDMTKTLFAPLEITANNGNGANYCRYKCKQIESNYVSPYVRVAGGNGYGNVFRDGHTEQRQNITGFNSEDLTWATLFSISSGEWLIDHWGAVQLTGFLERGAYSVITITNVQRGGAITQAANAANTTGSLTISDCSLASFVDTAFGGRLVIADSYFSGDVTFNYLVYELGFHFHDTYVGGNFMMANDSGASVRRRQVHHNYFIGKVNIQSVNRVHFVDNDCANDVNFASSRGAYERNDVAGIETIALDAIQKYIPFGLTETYGTAAPLGGTHAVGSKVWNINVAPGAPLGWVCTAAGSPGTWYAYAQIAA